MLLSRIDISGFLCMRIEQRLEVSMKSNVNGKTNDEMVKEEDLSVSVSIAGSNTSLLSLVRKYEMVPGDVVSNVI
jgi:hypothetical protein